MDNKKEKSSKGLIVLVVVLIIVIIALIGMFILYDKKITTGSSATVQNSSEEKKNTVKKKIIENTASVKFDKSKSLNNDDIKNSTGIDISESGSVPGINFYTDSSDNKKVKVNVNWKILNDNGFSNNMASVGYKSYNYDMTFDKGVVDFYGARLGFEGYDTVYLFLLEDGSVKYVPVMNIIDNQNFEVKSLDGVSDIIRFTNVGYTVANYDFGIVTTLAYKSDGSFYDLSKFISSFREH